MRDITCTLKAYIQPFEQQLGIMELEALAGSSAHRISNVHGGDTFAVRTSQTAAFLAKRLSYWETVHAGHPIYTLQLFREATTHFSRNGFSIDDLRRLLPFRSTPPIPNRRCLRYGTHGIHEYRGKFFPQLVRSLLNIARIRPGGVVADTMCGSGTTLVEAVLGGYHALGVDMNPLSVFMSQTKVSLLDVHPDVLHNAYERLKVLLLQPRTRSHAPLAYFVSLSKPDQKYLEGWFSRSALIALDRIIQAIHSFHRGPIREYFLLLLSNIIRHVSWQKDDDLRVRKEVRIDDAIDPLYEYIEELDRSIRTVLPFLYQNRTVARGVAHIYEGDARQATRTLARWSERVDVIVTSPPYATALPYLDTDRLSLCYLGLLDRPSHRARDQNMIGNRELTNVHRLNLWHDFERRRHELPSSIVNLINCLAKNNHKPDVGFRRKNLPALLSKYFFDMLESLREMHLLLRPGGTAFVVVGSNHTVSAGVRIDIPTPQFLASIAEAIGFENRNQIKMEMLASRDIHRDNACASESILVLHKSG